MNSPYRQLNLGLDLDLDIEAQEETTVNGRHRLYKLRVAKRFEHIIFGIYIFQYANFFITLAISFILWCRHFSINNFKYIILNGLSR